MSRIGLTIPFGDRPLSDYRDVVTELADLGYSDIWTSESTGTDAFTPLALVAAWEPRLRLGTGIASVYTRGPALLAQTAAAMAEAAPGRFVLGVGASSKPLVERYNGIPFENPYGRARDMLRFVRAALRGESVSTEGVFTVNGFRLARPPQIAPPVVLAALRPGMVRLAALEADGVMLNWLSSEDVRTVLAGYRDAGGNGEVVDRIMVCPNTDADAVRTAVRPLVATYLNVPTYVEFQKSLGREAVLTPMWQAWQQGDRKAAAAAVPDSVIDDIVVHGTLTQCREGLARFIEAGVTLPVLAFLEVGLTTMDAVRLLAPDGPA